MLKKEKENVMRKEGKGKKKQDVSWYLSIQFNPESRRRVDDLWLSLI